MKFSNWMQRLIGAALMALCAMIAAPAGAILPAPAEQPATETQPAEQPIDAARSDNQDALIADRIRGIFAELPAFQNVNVDVAEGVVSLSGTVDDGESIDRAQNIAGRVAGVVTVENALERDLSVDGNMSIVAKARDLAQRAIAIAPLLLVAIVTALVIGALGYVIAGFTGFWNRVAPNAFLGELLRSAIRFAFVVGGIVIALDMLGAGALMGAVLGGAGVVGIALGFAMRDTIENYVASLMLSLRQPFRANDHVLIDNLEGRVIRLTSRATVLMTLDGNHLRIPNSQVFKAVILNYTTNPQRRFEFELGVDADDDPRAAMKLGAGVLRELPFVLADPEPAARIVNVGDSNIVILFLGWIDQRHADWHKSRSAAIAAVKDALEQAGFALPEPIYRLRFDGRTDPLPIGRQRGSNGTEQHHKGAEAADTVPQAGPPDHDVRPESEIAEMVERERSGSGGEQADDLLDAARPVE